MRGCSARSNPLDAGLRRHHGLSWSRRGVARSLAALNITRRGSWNSSRKSAQSRAWSRSWAWPCFAFSTSRRRATCAACVRPRASWSSAARMTARRWHRRSGPLRSRHASRSRGGGCSRRDGTDRGGGLSQGGARPAGGGAPAALREAPPGQRSRAPGVAVQAELRCGVRRRGDSADRGGGLGVTRIVGGDDDSAPHGAPRRRARVRRRRRRSPC